MMTYMIKFCIFTAATILLSGLRKFILVIPPPLERSTELKGRCHESDSFYKKNHYYLREEGAPKRRPSPQGPVGD